jgi:DNA-binding winged helix-turn-helix (wHTH) protein
LLRDGAEIHLSPKAFDLLTLLVDNRARPMTRAELHERLWPTSFVQDTNLASLVAEIRRVLGDEADDPRFVRTLQRFGYWFIGVIQNEGKATRPAGAIRYWLVWEKRQIALNDGENMIGRAPEATAWIDALGVSRTHARIMVSDREATIEDLGSKNGTFVHDQRITKPCRLGDGDQIRLGSVVVTLRIPQAVESTETVSLR